VTLKIDPDRVNIPDDAWKLVEVTEDFMRYEAPLERLATGDVVYVRKTVPRGLTALLEDNKQALNDSYGKRFGDGQIVGRIPLNVLFDPKLQIAEKIREGDRDHIKYFLNSEAALPYRRFRGKV
jgi:hypothetical protein